jgi:hypothetical protein
MTEWGPGGDAPTAMFRAVSKGGRYAAWIVAGAFLFFSPGCSRPGPRTIDLRELLRAAGNGRKPLPQGAKLSKSDPLWAICRFLLASGYRSIRFHWLANSNKLNARLNWWGPAMTPKPHQAAGRLFGVSVP